MYLLKKKFFLYVVCAVLLVELVFLFCFLGTDFYRYFLAHISSDFLLELANKERESVGAEVLEVDFVLAEAALMKAQHMAENGYFAHTSPDGIAPWHWFKEAGYDFSHAGENLAVNFSDSERLHQAWLDSPSHRANIISGNFIHIGMASAKGEYKDREAVFVVQLFGRPKESLALPVEQKEQTEIKTAEDVFSQQDTEVLGEEALSAKREKAEDYESFVSAFKDENNEILQVSGLLTKRDEVKYVSLLSRIILLFNGLPGLLLFLPAFIVMAALSLKIIIRKKIKLHEAFINGILILLAVFFTLCLNTLLISTINI